MQGHNNRVGPLSRPTAARGAARKLGLDASASGAIGELRKLTSKNDNGNRPRAAAPAAAKMHLGENAFHMLVDQVAEYAIFMLDPQGKVVTWNAGAARIKGYAAGEVIGRHFSMFFPPGDRRAGKPNEALRRAAADGEFKDEGWRVRKDGSWFWARTTLTALHDAQGELRGFAKVTRDETERRKAEDNLRRNEAHLRATYDSAPVGIAQVGRDGKYLDVNAAMCRMLGYTREELLERTFRDVTHPDDLPMELERVRRVMAREIPGFTLEKRYVRKDGTVLPGRLSSSGMPDPSGQVAYRVSLIEDITERRRATAELEVQARQQALVAELGQIALASPSFQSLMDEVVRRVAVALEADFVKVLELRPDGRSLLLRAGVGWRAGLVGRATVRAGLDSQAGFTLMANEPVIVADLRSETRFHGPSLLRKHRVVSGMSTIIGGDHDRPYGVIGVHTKRPRDFTDDDVRCLRSVANILVTAIRVRRAEEALRQSEERFRTLADGSTALIWVNGVDGCEFVNHAYLQFLGATGVNDVKGYDWARFIHPQDRSGYLTAYREAFQRREPFEAQFRFRRYDGEYRWMKSSGQPRFDADGDCIGYAGSTTDITEILEAQRAIHESRERLDAVVNTAVDAIITIDDRGRIESVNPAVEHMFGYRAGEMIGRNVSMLMPEPYRGEHDGYIANYLRTAVAKIIGIGREVYGQRKDGTTFPMHLSVSEFRLGERRMFTGIVHDITQRRRLEREILEASANEQRRIGQDLHDGLCQQLAAISFASESLANRLARKAPDEAGAVEKIARLVDETLTQARGLARGLNPVDIEAGGITVALEQLAAKVTERFDVSCRFRYTGRVAVADSTTATHLYRIAQEATSNAIRHGRASRIDIALECVGDRLTLSVTDNGTGVAPARQQKGAGMGLQVMNYRARLIGATFSVRPGPGGGTLVACILRCPPEPPTGKGKPRKNHATAEEAAKASNAKSRARGSRRRKGKNEAADRR